MLLNVIFALASCSIAAAKSDSRLPTVDLGYELHQASSLNVSIHIYSRVAFTEYVNSKMEASTISRTLDTASHRSVSSDFVHHVRPTMEGRR